MATSKPFVPRDVFRLLVRLEAQKTQDIDTRTLETRFRVPPGYAHDETDEQRERKALDNTPGPGTYEVAATWGEEGVRQSAAFASKAQRDAFQLAALEKAAARQRAKLTSRGAAARTGDSPQLNGLDSPAPLGSFTKVDRGLSYPVQTKHPGRRHDQTELVPPAGKTSIGGLSFGRAPRSTHIPVVPPCPLGPAQYDVKRLWDPSEKTGTATPDAPTPAVFSASKDKREVVWSPARELPTNAVGEAWNSSEHYAKHKRCVLLEVDKEKCRRQGLMPRTNNALAHSASTPILGSQRRGRGQDSEKAGTALDPFEWIRRLPQGELRANALATKHGLGELIRSTTAHDHAGSHGVQDIHAGVHLGQLLHDQLSMDGTAASEEKKENDDDDPYSSRHGFLSAGSNRGGQRDERISVSCRLQGGLVLTVRIYSAKKVRHLKTAIVRKQTRYQNEDQFDLYLGNGKQLTQMEDTLKQAGVHDRSLVQIISR